LLPLLRLLALTSLFIPPVPQSNAIASRPIAAFDVNQIAVVINIVRPYAKPQPPDYAAIRLASDERLAKEKAQQEADAKEKARLAALEAAQQAQVQVPMPNTAPVVASTPTGRGDVLAAIVKWANYYHVDPGWLLRVANCESGFRSDVANGHYWAPDGSTPTGLFQFVRSTYIANAARAGLPAIDDRTNPDRSAQVAAFMFSIGESRQWECK
jgi:soluble lytic murein transglycosylase-like protein